MDVDAEQRPVAHLLVPSRPQSLNVFTNHVPLSASSFFGIIHLMLLLFVGLFNTILQEVLAERKPQTASATRDCFYYRSFWLFS